MQPIPKTSLISSNTQLLLRGAFASNLIEEELLELRHRPVHCQSRPGFPLLRKVEFPQVAVVDTEGFWEVLP